MPEAPWKEVGTAELMHAREVLRFCPGLSRTELTQTLCEHWGGGASHRHSHAQCPRQQFETWRYPRTAGEMQHVEQTFTVKAAER